MTDPRHEHLDPAMIASLVDNTIDPAARAAAEAHLAECADCREVWVETSEMAADRLAVVATPAVPRSRRSWLYVASGVAAAIVVAIVAPRFAEREPDIQTLVNAVGAGRRTEARLTGGFQWGPAPGSTRGGPPIVGAQLEAAAAELRAAARGSSDASAVGASGVAALVTGDLQAAITELERALTLDGAKPELRSDLSAAYLEAHRTRAQAGAAAKALEAAEQALRLSPRMPEALFNRALALSALGRDDEARRAWQLYLEVDAASGWAAEARERGRSPS